MKNSLKSIILIIACALAVFILLNPDESHAQRVLYLNKATIGSNPSGISQDTLKVGESIDIDIWFDISTTADVNGISCYINFDVTVFDVFDQVPGTPGIQPFLFNGLSAFNLANANNVIGNGQIVGHSNLVEGSVSMEGRFARIRLTAKKRATSAQVIIQYNVVNHQDTRMFFTNGSSRPFDRLDPMIIEVVGVNLEGIPDVMLEPGEEKQNLFDIDDFLIYPPDDLSSLLVSSSEENDSISVTINQVTHEVTIGAHEDYTGTSEVVFTVQEGPGSSDTDTINVIVSHKPVFSDFLKQNLIRFNEDEVYEGVWLDTLATDIDDSPGLLQWDAYSLHDSLSVSVFNGSSERTFTISPGKDWSGLGDIVFRVTDTYGAFDTLITTVNVLPVNDKPFFSQKLPDIHILPGETDSSIVLSEYVDDIDTPHSQLQFSPSGNTNVNLNFSPENTDPLKISANEGFIGEETVYITVRDTDFDPLSTSTDTIIVTVGPKPPEFILSLPDTIIHSTDVITVGIPYVDLNDYVIDPDNDIADLNWTYNENDVDISVVFDGSQTSFTVPALTHKVEEVIFTATDPGNSSASDTVQVLVIYNNWPLIYRLEEAYFVPIGGSVSPVKLDTVVYDDGPYSEITWTFSGLTNLTVQRDGATDILTFSSPNPDFVGEETLTVTATDIDGNSHSQEVLLRAIDFNRPFLQEIPDVSITQNSPRELDLDDYLIIYPDELRDEIIWTYQPVNDDKINISYVQSTNVVTFTVKDPAYKGSRSVTFTATNPNNSQSDSDGILVNVSLGAEPILGQLPDVSLMSGDTIMAFDLDPYVLDDDTPDDSLNWTFFNEKNNVFTDTTKLGRGKSHELYIWSERGYTGNEPVILTVRDPEGNTAHDTITVTVFSSATLDNEVLSSPASLDYIDLIVFASDTLVGTPSMTLQLNTDTPDEINLLKIPNSLIWKGDYVFQGNESGTVHVVTTAVDNSGSVIQDSIAFIIGDPDIFDKIALGGTDISMTFTESSALDKNKMILIPDYMNNRYESDADYPPGLELPAESWFIGPSEMIGFSEAILELQLDPESIDSDNVGHYGLYYNDNTGTVSWLAPVTGNNSLRAEIHELGQFFIAADFCPPEILMVQEYNPSSRKFTLRIAEDESGIARVESWINGKPALTTISGKSDMVYDVEVSSYSWNTGNNTVEFVAVDRSGNRSQAYVSQVQTDNRNIPETFSLDQNYPNPFNPETVIRYTIPEGAAVKLAVYNVQGQLIKVLAGSYQDAGTYSVKWDATNQSGMNVSAGIYIYRLIAGTWSASGKMVLLK